VAVADGRIAAVGPDLHLAAAQDIDASGLHVFTGGIDSHVHFNEPGRTEWETIANGSAALAAGGYTSFIDMPLNNLPVTTTAQAFDLKVEAMRRSASVDFGLWGGLVPGNIGELEPLVERGVMGFKAFMCPSGIDEFPMCDMQTLRAGMREIARLDSILLVHAEDPAVLQAPRGPSVQDFTISRPPEAEWAAIDHAVGLAAETGCRLHIVHVSTPQGFEQIKRARDRGVDVSGETCPHYLLLSTLDVERIGGTAKCAPPIRPIGVKDGVWDAFVDGRIAMVVSDHSPSTLDLKQGDDFSKLWGGVSGCQTTRHLLLRWFEPARVAGVTATNVARRFRIPHKGEIAEGFDADLWLVDIGHLDVVRSEDLLYRNRFSAFEGESIRGRTSMTLVRGRAPGRGRLIRPGGRS
jgi:allantoinase